MAAIATACEQAKGHDAKGFVEAYRKAAPLAIDAHSVETLDGAIAALEGAAADSARRAAAAADAVRTAGAGMFIPIYVGLAVLAGLVLFAVRRVGGLSAWMDQVYHQQRADAAGHVRTIESATLKASAGLHSALQTLDGELKQAIRNGKEEIRSLVSYVRSDVTDIRNRLPKPAGSDPPVDPDTYDGNTRWITGNDDRGLGMTDGYGDAEEILVDVRAVDGVAQVTQSERGKFRLRWSAGAGVGELSIDPSAVLGAGFRDNIDAAFDLRNARRGSDQYRTVTPATCTWDSASGQGRVKKKGLLDEVG